MSKILIVFSILVLFTPSVQACKATIKIGLGSLWPPYYFEQNQRPVGIDIEVIELILSQADYCIEYKKMSTTRRANVELMQGNIDLLYAASYSEERDRFGFFSLPYREENVRIFWRQKEDVDLLNGDLYTLLNAGLIGAINAGSYFGPVYNNMIHDELRASITNVPTIESRMKMLEFQRIDFFLEDELTGLFFLQKNKAKNIVLHPFVLYQNDVSLLFSRKTFSSAQLQEINEQIIQNKTKIGDIIQSHTRLLN